VSHEETRATIVAERGAHFDPNIVDAFLQVEDEFLAVREQYAENRPERLHSPAEANLSGVACLPPPTWQGTPPAVRDQPFTGVTEGNTHAHSKV
jgi:hypothetical protein